MTAVYFLLPDSAPVTAAGSAAFAYGAAVAVVAGARRHRPAHPWSWYLIAAAPPATNPCQGRSFTPCYVGRSAPHLCRSQTFGSR